MKANQQLFLDKFISVNQQKYADQPEVLALLEGLTLADITFARLEEDSTLGDGGRIADFESEVRKFNAIDQQWICAELGSPGIVDTIDDTVYADAAAIEAVGVAGVYRMTGTNADRLVVVLDYATMTEAEIKAAVFDAITAEAAFELKDDQFSWPEVLEVGTQFEALVTSDTIESALTVHWLPDPTPPAPPEEETPPANEGGDEEPPEDPVP